VATKATVVAVAATTRRRWMFIAAPFNEADGRLTRPWHGCGGLLVELAHARTLRRVVAIAEPEDVSGAGRR
jgi:hypothetical protein